MRLGPQIAEQAQRAFADGVQAAFLTASIALAVTAVVFAALHRTPRAAANSVAEPADQADKLSEEAPARGEIRYTRQV